MLFGQGVIVTKGKRAGMKGFVIGSSNTINGKEYKIKLFTEEPKPKKKYVWLSEGEFTTCPWVVSLQTEKIYDIHERTDGETVKDDQYAIEELHLNLIKSLGVPEEFLKSEVGQALLNNYYPTFLRELQERFFNIKKK